MDPKIIMSFNVVLVGGEFAKHASEYLLYEKFGEANHETHPPWIERTDL